ncbi:hypothetical protein C9374_000895 [Naegleria lovaniensis]|uniref:Uncharacterized protein n=1 Tax=Naegleria lovaniensis TaxID=51637 RepID=A0AA88KLN1_NAELO|nr:uncharacterized protein C9374_000895 [Naegleria lovaniensis]KAG2388045.1 hypothetical protein C9374_000895 [Naegleria lovaniensis]
MLRKGSASSVVRAREWNGDIASSESMNSTTSHRKTTKTTSSNANAISNSKQISSPTPRSGNQKKVSHQTLENLLDHSKTNTVLSQAKLKTKETTNKVDKLALETVILEEELNRLKSNIMKEKENWKNVPKQGIWKSSQKIRDNMSGHSPLMSTKSNSSQRDRRPSSSSSSYTGEGKVIKIRSSVTNFQVIGEQSCNKDAPQPLKTKPIPGTVYEEICELPENASRNSENQLQTYPKQTKLAEGQYDEALQQKLFQEAVRSWREGSQTQAEEMPNSTTGGGLLRQGDYDEELQQRLFRDAVAAWRGESKPQVTKPATSNAETSSDPFVEKKSSGLSMFQTEFVENLCNATRYTYFDKHFRSK